MYQFNPLPDAPLWDLAVQRSVADPIYRARLLATPAQALQEIGISTDGLAVIVRELASTDRILLLPPPRAEEQDHSPSSTPAEGRTPSTADAPSRPMRGSAACALSDPDDTRAVYGLETTIMGER